ncbi:type I restriction-modification system subunit M N-terminal domain-containing protein [Achromobacter aloeverae]|uniref:type I restriction-modification system subunit M N-terminal domain-containing protein n=1 Tax=Achromobacter aloeverae TaxID=1750518 RepID=UPI0026BD3F9D
MNQDLKKTLRAHANELRSSMGAPEYKHIVLGLIFLKYISDAFDERRAQLLAAFRDETGGLYPPDRQEEAAKTVLRQAKLLSAARVV